MTQFILPSASVSVTIVIPRKAFPASHRSLGAWPHQVMRALEGDFRVQPGTTWPEVSGALAVGKQRERCFQCGVGLYQQKPTTKK